MESFQDEESETAACKYLISERFKGVVVGFVLLYTAQLMMSSITGKCLEDQQMNAAGSSNTNLQEKDR